MSNDVSVVAGFVEYLVEGLAVPSSDTPVVFDIYMPSQERWRPRAGEWIDVRPFLWGTIVATAVDQDAVYTVEYKRGTNDPAPQDLVAATTVTAGVTNELYASTLENISHVRLVHRHTGVAGTTTASILGK